MGNNKIAVQISAERKEDGRFHLELYTSERMDVKEVLNVLTSGINLTIRGINTPEKQGKALRGVIDLMEMEFVNIDSFKDLYINENGKVNF